MAYPLKFNSAGQITIGPLVSTDGITPYAGGNIVLIGNADEAELIKHGAGTTAPLTTANNTVSAIANCDGYYTMSYLSADTDTYGALDIVFQDDSLYLPYRKECLVMNADAYDAMYSGSNPYALSQEVADVRSDLTIVGVDAAGTRSDLNNATDGLSAIKAVVDAAATAVEMAGTRSDIAIMDANIDTLITESAEQTSDINVLVTGVNVSSMDTDVITAASLHSEGVAKITKDVFDRPLTKALHDVAQSAGKRLRQIDAAFVVASGTAQAGTANTITLAAGESATNNIFNGDRVIIIDGTGAGEHGLIISYDGGTKVATMAENWVITPDATSEYELVPADADIESWQHGVVNAPTVSGHPRVDVCYQAGTLQTAGDVIQEIADTQSDIAVVDGNVDTLVTEMAGTRSDIAIVDANVDTMVLGIITGSAQTGTLSTTQATTDLSGYTDDQLIGRIITVTSGNADGESSAITDYANASGLITFDAMTLAMGNGDTFKIT